MSMTSGIDFREFAGAVGTIKDYDDGDLVFREGDRPAFMYVVLSGAVDLGTQSKTLERIGSGRALGILSLLDDLPRTVTARANGATQLAVIDRKKFRFMIEEMPNFCWYVMGELAHRLRTTNAALFGEQP
jgi:CRP/FNR family transcriptional regulator, cyclic AMP receptor protein